MKFRPVLSFFLAIVFASVSFAQSTFAQRTPVFEAALGYSFLRQEFNMNRHGWVASAAGNVNSWFGVKGEAGGSYTDAVNNDVHSFMAGPQIAARGEPTVTPWGHFLLGVVRTQRTVALFFPPGPAVGLTGTDSDFAIQPGAGLDLWVHPHFGIRLGADYRRSIRAGPRNDIDQGRLYAGIVFRIGSK